MSEHRSTILIVDDEPQNLHLLGEALRGEHEIIVATNGHDALKRARSDTPPDLILLDIMMPEIDGYQVCRQLQDDPDTAAIPVIFVTAMDDVVDETAGLEAGAVDYITKPFSPAIVQARVRTHLKLKAQTDLLTRLATQDSLTGLSNRRHFDQCLNAEWQRAGRSHSPLSLVMMDIDFFKDYNDNYGHGAGDECLRKVAEALVGVVHRGGDVVARYGGEEFVAILPATDADYGLHIADQFRLQVAALGLKHNYSAVNDYLTISVGVATCIPAKSDTVNSLLTVADKMLYEAKKRGRNCVVGNDISTSIGAPM